MNDPFAAPTIPALTDGVGTATISRMANPNQLPSVFRTSARSQLESSNSNILQQASQASYSAADTTTINSGHPNSSGFAPATAFDFGGFGNINNLQRQLPVPTGLEEQGNLNTDDFGSLQRMKQDLARKGFGTESIEGKRMFDRPPSELVKDMSFLDEEKGEQEGVIDEEKEEKLRQIAERAKKWPQLQFDKKTEKLEHRYRAKKEIEPKEILLPHKIWVGLLFVIFIIEIASLSLSDPARSLGNKFNSAMAPFVNSSGFNAATPDVGDAVLVWNNAGLLLYASNVCLGLMMIFGLFPVGFIAIMRYRGHSILVSRLLFYIFFMFSLWIGLLMAMFAGAALAIEEQVETQKSQFQTACGAVGYADADQGVLCNSALDGGISNVRSTLSVPAGLMFVVCILLVVSSFMAMQLRKLVPLDSKEPTDIVSADFKGTTTKATFELADFKNTTARMQDDTIPSRKLTNASGINTPSAKIVSFTPHDDNSIASVDPLEQIEKEKEEARKKKLTADNSAPKKEFFQELPPQPMSFEEQQNAVMQSFLALPTGYGAPKPPMEPPPQDDDADRY